ncbi:ABC transporter permease [Marinoscillum furvescens]|uniref:ABC-2 type transport system permease protein n=1 Tax=Marinoscillum furvescens DSM 4134 TaxID=1122208 RepID=A0A3D9KY46_MARFU|nr:ABC transporter permease subunit [Marinoscillum furvescens]RED92229.1 ABC-2 type transport system permease protein [Marinoscillum furvescens DSM 4134]
MEKTNNAIAATISSTSQALSNAFWVMVRKEIAGQIRSWKFIVLLVLILLTYWGSLLVSMSNLRSMVASVRDADELFLYLKLLTSTEGSLPPFHVFLNFLGPLLGISMGFDAINSEKQSGTLSRIMAQPVYRDNLLLSKFVSVIILVGTLLVCLTLLMIGTGTLLTGILIELEEVLRIFAHVLISLCYIAFWLAIAILLSILFRQPATSALTAIGIWLFFTVFYEVIVNLAVKAMIPDPAPPAELMRFYDLLFSLTRLAPSQLYADATTTLLMPSVRSLGPVTMDQMAGAIPTALPFKDSLMIVWPQVSGLLAATVSCFAYAYYKFMRREIRT